MECNFLGGIKIYVGPFLSHVICSKDKDGCPKIIMNKRREGESRLLIKPLCDCYFWSKIVEDKMGVMPFIAIFLHFSIYKYCKENIGREGK